jgi:hypothetical protein
MNAVKKSINPVESNVYELRADWKPVIHYTIKSPNPEDDEFTSVSFRAVLNWLRDDDKLIEQINEEFIENKESKWDEDSYNEYVESRIEEVAKENGYVFFEVLK